MSIPRQKPLILTILFGLGCSPLASASSPDRSPHPALMLHKTAQFVTVNRWDCAALYQLSDGSLLRQFEAGKYITAMDVSLDDQYLVAGCAEGPAFVWKIQTGELICSIKSPGDGDQYIRDVSFAADGASFVLACAGGRIAVHRTESGRLVSEMTCGSDVMSAALSPSGGQGVAVDSGQQLYTFNVVTGQMKGTSIRGAGPVRFSAKGNWIALRLSDNLGFHESVRLVQMDEKATQVDLGPYGNIRHIRPTAEGDFLISSEERNREDISRSPFAVGRRIATDKQTATELWRVFKAWDKIDFDPDRLMGVCTHWTMETEVYDLRKDTLVYKIDNRAGKRWYATPEFWSLALLGDPCTWIAVATAGVLLGTGWWVWRRLSRPSL